MPILPLFPAGFSWWGRDWTAYSDRRETIHLLNWLNVQCLIRKYITWKLVYIFLSRSNISRTIYSFPLLRSRDTNMALFRNPTYFVLLWWIYFVCDALVSDLYVIKTIRCPYALTNVGFHKVTDVRLVNINTQVSVVFKIKKRPLLQKELYD